MATDSTTAYDQRSVIDYLSDAPHTARIYPVSGAIAIDAFVTVPRWTHVFHDDFSQTETDQWFNDAFVEAVTNSGGYLDMSLPQLVPAAIGMKNSQVQVDIMVESGTPALYLNSSMNGSYHLTLATNGTLTLYRTDVVLSSTSIPNFSTSTRYVLAVTIWDGVITVSVDGQVLLTVTDSNPLPIGTISIGNETVDSSYQLHAIDIWMDGREALPANSDPVAAVRTDPITDLAIDSNMPSDTTGNVYVPGDIFSADALPITYRQATCSGSSCVVRMRDFTGNAYNIYEVTDPRADYYSEAEWSPDGTQLLMYGVQRPPFPSFYSESFISIYTPLADDSWTVQRLQITTPSAAASGPGTSIVFEQRGWSPDGTKILVHYQDDDDGTIVGYVDIAACIANTCVPTPLTNDSDENTHDFANSWSSDGSQILFNSNRSGTRELYTVDVNTGAVSPPLTSGTPVDATYRDADWSPNGQFVAYSAVNGQAGDTNAPYNLVVLDLSSGVSYRLTDMPVKRQLTRPEWSSDGTQLIFQDLVKTTYSDNYYVRYIELFSLTEVSDIQAIASGRNPHWWRQGPAPTECLVQVQNIGLADVPQMLYDMRAGVAFPTYIANSVPTRTPLGLHIHSAPGINTPKMNVGGDRVPFWRNGAVVTSLFIAKAVYNIHFSTTGQRWLGIESFWFQDASGNIISFVELAEVGWILVETLGEVYAVPYPDNTSACVDNLPQPTTLTYVYDRQAAVQYAIVNAYQNEVSPPPNQYMTQRLDAANLTNYPTGGMAISAIPYAHFQTATINPHTGAATGSASFISQAWWMGGLPMTLSLEPDGVPSTTNAPYTDPGCEGAFTWLDTNNNLIANDLGWRHCQASGTTGDGNQTWMNHQGLVHYFTNVVLPDVNDLSQPMPLAPTQLSEVLPETSRGFNITQPPNTSNIASPAILQSDLDGLITLRDGIVNFPNLVGTLVRERLTVNILGNQFSLVQAGDYIWVSSENERTHGFINVGFGDAVSCDVVLSTGGTYMVLDIDLTDGIDTGLYMTYQDAIAMGVSNPVPYVADFSFMLQQPLPRPFYCSQYDENNGQNPDWSFFAAPHDWYFFTMPDQVEINTTQLYIDGIWNWSSTDGR